MTPTILVTGATGHIGREVVRQLSTKDVTVKAAVRSPDLLDWHYPNVTAVKFDYDNPQLMEAAFSGVDRLYMMAPVEVKFVERMTRMIETAKQTGIKRIVHQSQFSANAKPGMQGTWWHSQMETATRNSGIPYSILEPNAFMQNVITRYADDIRNCNALIVPAGDSRVSFIDPQDIAAAAVVLLTEEGHEGKTFPVTGPESLSFNDLAQILTEVLGRTITYIDQSDDEFRKRAASQGMPDIAIQLTLDGYMVEKLQCYAEVTHTFKQLTGREPRRFEAWAQEHIADFTPTQATFSS